MSNMNHLPDNLQMLGIFAFNTDWRVFISIIANQRNSVPYSVKNDTKYVIVNQLNYDVLSKRS